MDIYEFALNMEKDGEALYREAARQTQNKGLAAIFTFLADAEVAHCKALMAMRQGQKPELTGTVALDNVKNVFAQVTPAGPDALVDREHTDLCVALYRRALDFEKKSVDFYLGKAGEEGDPRLQVLLRKLANEEERHCWVLDNIVEHVSRPDHGWIEFAEWHHQEQY
ncbi:MAG: hypothetical protein A3K19_33040 [Lentisphaerae bacterium RIFOXYB12_FULL_65_16]|nr:MAG: hypothetical protein A3K18_31675 [Lentisphaerae bacterium RIFOXYA12_64_32]OGV87013.1 MAG: hypothetical protein A3K19_33040 [Lentisphaerae bacterium RIFOXYB12_FULL_65_16]